MSEYGLSVAAQPLYYPNTPFMNNYSQTIPQVTTSEETRQYLAINYPDAYNYLEQIDSKYHARQLTPEEREELMNTQVGSAQSQAVKKLVEKGTKLPFVKRCWKNIKNFFVRLIKGDEKAQKQLVTYYNDTQKIEKIADLYNQLTTDDNSQKVLYC